MQDSLWVKKKDTSISIWLGMETIVVVQQDGNGLPNTADNGAIHKKRDESAYLFCCIMHFKLNFFFTLTRQTLLSKFQWLLGNLCAVKDIGQVRKN